MSVDKRWSEDELGMFTGSSLALTHDPSRMRNVNQITGMCCCASVARVCERVPANKVISGRLCVRVCERECVCECVHEYV